MRTAVFATTLLLTLLLIGNGVQAQVGWSTQPILRLQTTMPYPDFSIVEKESGGQLCVYEDLKPSTGQTVLCVADDWFKVTGVDFEVDGSVLVPPKNVSYHSPSVFRDDKDYHLYFIEKRAGKTFVRHAISCDGLSYKILNRTVIQREGISDINTVVDNGIFYMTVIEGDTINTFISTDAFVWKDIGNLGLKNQLHTPTNHSIYKRNDDKWVLLLKQKNPNAQNGQAFDTDINIFYADNWWGPYDQSSWEISGGEVLNGPTVMNGDTLFITYHRWLFSLVPNEVQMQSATTEPVPADLQQNASNVLSPFWPDTSANWPTYILASIHEDNGVSCGVVVHRMKWYPSVNAYRRANNLGDLAFASLSVVIADTTTDQWSNIIKIPPVPTFELYSVPKPEAGCQPGIYRRDVNSIEMPDGDYCLWFQDWIMECEGGKASIADDD